MTVISGVHILAAPCCGARYSAPLYLSMNFMAVEYWTDGWREGSLMPNDEGLRRCKCGQFVLMEDLIAVATTETSDLQQIVLVPDTQLRECLAAADRAELEVTARLQNWRHLKHPYRQMYRRYPGC